MSYGQWRKVTHFSFLPRMAFWRLHLFQTVVPAITWKKFALDQKRGFLRGESVWIRKSNLLLELWCSNQAWPLQNVIRGYTPSHSCRTESASRALSQSRRRTWSRHRMASQIPRLDAARLLPLGTHSIHRLWSGATKESTWSAKSHHQGLHASQTHKNGSEGCVIHAK